MGGKVTLDPNVALGVLTAFVIATVFIMERIARSNGRASDALGRIDAHEKVCTERQKRIEDHLRAIDSKMEEALDRRRHQR